MTTATLPAPATTPVTPTPPTDDIERYALQYRTIYLVEGHAYIPPDEFTSQKVVPVPLPTLRRLLQERRVRLHAQWRDHGELTTTFRRADPGVGA
jgi:hypothetical protein